MSRKTFLCSFSKTSAIIRLVVTALPSIMVTRLFIVTLYLVLFGVFVGKNFFRASRMAAASEISFFCAYCISFRRIAGDTLTRNDSVLSFFIALLVGVLWCNIACPRIGVKCRWCKKFELLFFELEMLPLRGILSKNVRYAMRTLKRDELARRIDATGLKPYAFAKKCGIVPESLRRWLNGARVPKVENIQKMAEFLHCSVADISEWAFVLD